MMNLISAYKRKEGIIGIVRHPIAEDTVRVVLCRPCVGKTGASMPLFLLLLLRLLFCALEATWKEVSFFYFFPSWLCN